MTKVVVIGGTGLIGSKVVARLAEHGHQAIAASPNSGVNTLTGQGLAEVLAGADALTLGLRFEDWLEHTTPQN
jgi:uncharacterized protein YbjT (DUF2867 family)